MKSKNYSSLVAFLAFCLLFQAVFNTVVAGYWSMNRGWIAKNLCEKRLEKKSCCEGACQLEKWMSEETNDKSSSSPISGLKNLKEVELFFEIPSIFEATAFVNFEIRQPILAANERLPRIPNLDSEGKPPQV